MMRKVRAAVAVLMIAGGLCSSAAEVPVEIQMPLLVTIWKLDRNFKVDGGSVTVAIIFQETNHESAAAHNAVTKWLVRKNVKAVSVALDRSDALESLRTLPADVFYVTSMRGVDIEKIAAIARSRQIRTMAATPEYVRLGLNVAIGARNDRPLVIINLEAARAEGAAYQAQLLQLAEIVKR
jgi:hypothetical protein